MFVQWMEVGGEEQLEEDVEECRKDDEVQLDESGASRAPVIDLGDIA